MLPIIFGFLRSYAPYITLPVAALIGFIGYHIEDKVSDKYTPYQQSIEEKREERFLNEGLSKDVTDVDSLKEKKFVPKTILDRNVPPHLKQS